MKEEYGFIKKYKNEKIFRFSGTVLRKYIKIKKRPPAYLIRKDIYDILVNRDCLQTPNCPKFPDFCKFIQKKFS